MHCKSCVGRLTASRLCGVAKGGITSSDVGREGPAREMRQGAGARSGGIPVWRTGAEACSPARRTFIFPAMMGEVSTLREAVEILLG